MKVFHDHFLSQHRSPFGAVKCGALVSLAARCEADECVLIFCRDGEGAIRQPMRRSGELWRTELRAPDEPGPVWYKFECPGYA